MSLQSYALDAAWRDYYGQWNPYVEALTGPLELSKCHACRIALAPSLDQITVPPTGKIEYMFHLVPGSLIWGLLTTDQFKTFQLTDVGVGHQLFQEPLQPSTATLVENANLGNGRFSPNLPFYFMFPTPWPVTGDGLFRLEAWDTPGNLWFMLLLVAEVTNCPVR